MRWGWLFLFSMAGVLFQHGCSDPAPAPADPAIRAAEEGKLFRCRNCRKTVENRAIRRLNQTMGRCPHCGKNAPMIPVEK